MFYKYEIGYGGDNIGICYSYKKAIKIADQILDVVKNNSFEDEDYRLLSINRYSMFDVIFNSDSYQFDIKKLTVIIWSEVENKYLKCKNNG